MSQKTISPIDNSVVVERSLLSKDDIKAKIQASKVAFKQWRTVPLDERIKIVSAFVDNFVAKGSEIAQELTLQMGRQVICYDFL